MTAFPPPEPARMPDAIAPRMSLAELVRMALDAILPPAPELSALLDRMEKPR